MLGSPCQASSKWCPENADGHREDEVLAGSDDNDGLESDGDLPPVPNTGKVGAAQVYVMPNGEKVCVGISENYAYRDPLLYDINFDEFVMAFRVEKACMLYTYGLVLYMSVFSVNLAQALF